MTQTQTPEQEMAILYPEVAITVGGEELLVREFTFIEGIRLRPVVAPIIADLSRLIDQCQDDIGLDALGEMVSLHAEAFTNLMALSVDRDMDWVAQLGDRDGQLLLMTFWEVNSDFFVRRLVTERMASHQAAAVSPPPSPH